jgi:hypothetical protein
MLPHTVQPSPYFNQDLGRKIRDMSRGFASVSFGFVCGTSRRPLLVFACHQGHAYFFGTAVPAFSLMATEDVLRTSPLVALLQCRSHSSSCSENRESLNTCLFGVAQTCTHYDMGNRRGPWPDAVLSERGMRLQVHQHRR